jgi:hypothetical protein
MLPHRRQDPPAATPDPHAVASPAAMGIVIDRRFRGPKDSGHGGYSAGALAARLGGDRVEVTLRLPPPLERALTVAERDGGLALLDGDALVAEARRGEPEVGPLPAIGLDAARAARPTEAYEAHHPFPECFGCGPQRDAGDALRIFAGPVPGHDDVCAAEWTPDPDLAGADGTLPAEMVWAALDCPSAVPVANPGNDPPIVLARLAARIERPVVAGRPHALVAWPIELDGRKRHAGVALYDEGGEPLAWARALWISLRAAP